MLRGYLEGIPFVADYDRALALLPLTSWNATPDSADIFARMRTGASYYESNGAFASVYTAGGTARLL